MNYKPYTHCITRKAPSSELNVFTQAGAKETLISGLCEICFDKLFEDMEEDYED